MAPRPPLLLACRALEIGKSVESVLPERYALPLESTAIAYPVVPSPFDVEREIVGCRHAGDICVSVGIDRDAGSGIEIRASQIGCVQNRVPGVVECGYERTDFRGRNGRVAGRAGEISGCGLAAM
jgi:hypothetical protein